MFPIPWRSVVTILVLSLLALFSIIGSGVYLGVSIPDLTRDLAATAEVHPLTGALSSLGILLWWTSASVWMFSWAIHRKSGRRESSVFALSFGLLSIYLALDDLFQIHEYIATYHFGIRENSIYATIILCVFIVLLVNRRQLFRPDTALLAASFTGLACSIAVDTVLESWLMQLGQWFYLIEDGVKWVGIVFWSGFCVTRCFVEINISGVKAVSISSDINS